jgi:hypothetical protein
LSGNDNFNVLDHDGRFTERKTNTIALSTLDPDPLSLPAYSPTKKELTFPSKGITKSKENLPQKYTDSHGEDFAQKII